MHPQLAQQIAQQMAQQQGVMHAFVPRGESKAEMLAELKAYLSNLSGPMDACAKVARHTIVTLLRVLADAEEDCKQLAFLHAARSASSSSSSNSIVVPNMGVSLAVLNLGRAQVCSVVAAYLRHLLASCQSCVKDLETQEATAKEQAAVGIGMQVTALEQECEAWQKRRGALAARLRALAEEKDAKLKHIHTERRRLEAKSAMLQAATDASSWRSTKEETPESVQAEIVKLCEEELAAIDKFKTASTKAGAQLQEADARANAMLAQRDQAVSVQRAVRVQLNGLTSMLHTMGEQEKCLAQDVAEVEQCAKVAMDDAYVHSASVLPKLGQREAEVKQELARCERGLQLAGDQASDTYRLAAMTRLYLLVTLVRLRRAEHVHKAALSTPAPGRKAVRFAGGRKDHDAEAEEKAAVKELEAAAAEAAEEEEGYINEIVQLCQEWDMSGVDPHVTQPGWLWAPYAVQHRGRTNLQSLAATLGRGSRANSSHMLAGGGSRAGSADLRLGPAFLAMHGLEARRMSSAKFDHMPGLELGLPSPNYQPRHHSSSGIPPVQPVLAESHHQPLSSYPSRMAPMTLMVSATPQGPCMTVANDAGPAGQQAARARVPANGADLHASLMVANYSDTDSGGEQSRSEHPARPAGQAKGQQPRARSKLQQASGSSAAQPQAQPTGPRVSDGAPRARRVSAGGSAMAAARALSRPGPDDDDDHVSVSAEIDEVLMAGLGQVGQPKQQRPAAGQHAGRLLTQASTGPEDGAEKSQRSITNGLNSFTFLDPFIMGTQTQQDSLAITRGVEGYVTYEPSDTYHKARPSPLIIDYHNELFEVGVSSAPGGRAISPLSGVAAQAPLSAKPRNTPTGREDRQKS